MTRDFLFPLLFTVTPSACESTWPRARVPPTVAAQAPSEENNRPVRARRTARKDPLHFLIDSHNHQVKEVPAVAPFSGGDNEA